MKLIPQMFHDWAVSVHGSNYKTKLSALQLAETENAFISGFGAFFIFSTKMRGLPDHYAKNQLTKIANEVREWFANAGKGIATPLAPNMPSKASEVLITPDIEQAPWTELERTFKVNGLGKITRIGRLPKGTVEGNSTVTVAITMASGETYCGQTTLKLFLATASALKAREEEMSGSNSRN